jgi:hypothetical protein
MNKVKEYLVNFYIFLFVNLKGGGGATYIGNTFFIICYKN